MAKTALMCEAVMAGRSSRSLDLFFLTDGPQSDLIAKPGAAQHSPLLSKTVVDININSSAHSLLSVDLFPPNSLVWSHVVCYGVVWHKALHIPAANLLEQLIKCGSTMEFLYVFTIVVWVFTEAGYNVHSGRTPPVTPPVMAGVELE